MAPSWNPQTQDAAISLAGSIIKLGCGAQFGPIIGDAAGTITEIAGSVISDRLQQRRLNRMFDQCIDIVSEQILTFLLEEYRNLPDNERSAAILAVRDTFAMADLTPRRFTELDLNPYNIQRDLEPSSRRILASALLSADATQLYEQIYKECCGYLVEFIATLPRFSTDALTELLRRDTQIRMDLQQLLRRLPASRSDDDYALEYQRVIIRKLDRMELFGVDLDQASRRYPLSVAYVSLRVIRNQAARRNPQQQPSVPSSGSRVERALASLRTVLVVGEAGSGKTTLLRWLAVSSATRTFTGDLEKWNNCIPFLISLREFVDRDFPKPKDFPGLIAPSLSSEIPTVWASNLLLKGQALVLVDGVDELPEGAKREAAREWLADLVSTYPNSRYVVTSRPATIRYAWPDKDFAIAELQPMTMEDIWSFVDRWYSAIEQQVGYEASKEEEFDEQRRTLRHTLEIDRNLRRLAINPLLCSLICAINRSHRGQLPQDRMGIYNSALEMFLGRRDRERRIPVGANISTQEQLVILQQLAFWLIRQNLTTVSTVRAQEVIDRVLLSLRYTDGSSTVLRYLLERSGLLREPILDQVDFVHRSFQDYLAARAAVDGDEIESLVNNASQDNWRDTIIFAVGHSNSFQRERLLEGLVNLSRDLSEPQRTRIALLTIASLQTAPQLRADLRNSINDMARPLLPPKDIEAAAALAPAGDLVVEIMLGNLPTNEAEAVASIRLASMVGGEEALELIAKIVSTNSGVLPELFRAQNAFEPDVYAEKIFRVARFPATVEINDPTLYRYLYMFESVKSLSLDTSEFSDLTRLQDPPPTLSDVVIYRGEKASSIRGIERWNGIGELTIETSYMIPDLAPLIALVNLRALHLKVKRGLALGIDLEPLAALPLLRELEFDFAGFCRIELAPLEGRQLAIKVSQSVDVSGFSLLDSKSELVVFADSDM